MKLTERMLLYIYDIMELSSDSAETRYLRLVYLARVGRVEQLFAERDQQNLRYYDACDGYHAEKHGQVDEQPVGHGLWIFESFRKS